MSFVAILTLSDLVHGIIFVHKCLGKAGDFVRFVRKTRNGHQLVVETQKIFIREAK